MITQQWCWDRRQRMQGSPQDILRVPATFLLYIIFPLPAVDKHSRSDKKVRCHKIEGIFLILKATHRLAATGHLAIHVTDGGVLI